jgi:uncharacterized membrane protein YeaQ/YmgE (transglycosylase-associated protein family)
VPPNVRDFDSEQFCSVSISRQVYFLAARGDPLSALTASEIRFAPCGGPSPRAQNLESQAMSGESLIIILVVGLVAGWLAGQIVRGTGLGIIGDIIVGIAGAFIGGWLLPRLNIHLGVGIAAAIINATIGAVVLLAVIKLVRGGSGWGPRRG